MRRMIELVRQIDILQGRVQQVEKENDFLREQLRLLTAQLYGRKSERLPQAESPQMMLFDEASVEPESTEAVEGSIEIAPHRRTKSGRKPLPENLPRVEIVHDVTEEEKRCGCGAAKSRIGEEVAEQLEVVPARVQVLRHIRPKYACRQCEGVEDHGPTVVIAPPPAQIIPKSMVSAGLLAYILVGKFADALPFYRQEAMFKRLGVEVNRTSMCNWSVQAGLACQPLLELLGREIRSGPLINIDETTVQVLDEPGRSPADKSYMWIFRGGHPERPALEFRYHPGRDGRVAADYLADYKGYVQTDGYSGYGFLDRRDEIIHLGCWAHVRRKFVDVLKAAGNLRSRKKTGVAEEAVERIKALYAIEREALEAKLGPTAITRLRQEKSAPLIESMHTWLQELSPEVPPKSLLGKAIAYALGQWPRLSHYIKDGHLRPDNNLAENAIRPFVVGRKNWLFSGNAEGARASACLYSLIETAKANKLEPYWYLRHLFERLPLASSEQDLRMLLPQNIDRKLIAVAAPA
jgi:transposase